MTTRERAALVREITLDLMAADEREPLGYDSYERLAEVLVRKTEKPKPRRRLVWYGGTQRRAAS